MGILHTYLESAMGPLFLIWAGQKKSGRETESEREGGGRETEKRQKFRAAYKQKVKSFVKSLQRLGLSQWIWPGFATTVNNIWPKKKVKPRQGGGCGEWPYEFTS